MDWLKKAVGPAVGGILGIAGAQRGASRDYRYGLKQEAELWKRGQERGLTPQEYYGSSAPGGAANFSSGAAQTMGNAASKMGGQMAEMAFQADQRDKDRTNAKDIAQIQAGAQQYTADSAADVNREKIAVEIRKHEEIGLRQLSAQLRISEQDLKIKINQVTTQSPAFLREMKRLGMGTENMYVETVLRSYGITDFDQIPNMPDDKRRELMQTMLAGSSGLAKNLAALKGEEGSADRFFSDWKKVHDFIMKWMPGMESTADAAVGIQPKNRGPIMGTSRPGGKGPYRPNNYRDY